MHIAGYADTAIIMTRAEILWDCMNYSSDFEIYVQAIARIMRHVIDCGVPMAKPCLS